MISVNRFVTAAAAAVVLAAAAPAQAGTLQGPSDFVPTLEQHQKTPLVSHEVIATKSSAKGMSIVYGNRTHLVAAIGPRDVGNRALDADVFGLGAPRITDPQVAEK